MKSSVSVRGIVLTVSDNSHSVDLTDEARSFARLKIVLGKKEASVLSLVHTLALAGVAAVVALSAASIPALAPIRPYDHFLLDQDRHIDECQLVSRSCTASVSNVASAESN
jgi:hypothetical protein